MQPEILQLKEALAEDAEWTTKMGGLIPSWSNYHDEANSVSRPVQMGPVWLHAATVANKPIAHLLWMKDPPASSYPSCIAVKCAQLQSPDLGEELLYLLRVAAMHDGKNIAKTEVISEIAEKLQATHPAFDLKRFIEDYNGETGAVALKQDLQDVQFYRISRFPSIVVKSTAGKTILLQGFRTFANLQKELLAAFPD